MNPSLLNEILDLMKDGRVHSKESLVSALGTSAAMADMMIEHLIRMGYVVQIGGESARDLCSLCDQNRGSRTPCTLCNQQGRALLLTRKGMNRAAAPEAGPGVSSCF
jgi:biotin operon repressor